MRITPGHLLKLYRNLPIRSKLGLVLYIQILIPLILVGYLSYRNSEDILKNRSADYSRDVLKMIELRLNDCINNLDIISEDLPYQDRVYNILKSDSKRKDPISSYEYENEVNSLLKKTVLVRPEIQSIGLISNNGTWYYADNNSKDISIRKILPLEKVREVALSAQGKAAWYLDVQNRNTRYVYLVRTVVNRDSFKEMGLLAVLIKKEFLETVYDGLTGNLKNIAILSSKGDLIVARDPSDPYIFNRMLAQDSNGEAPDRAQGAPDRAGAGIDREAGVFTSYIVLKEPDWKVMAYVTLDELYRDAYNLRRNILILCILSVVILSILCTLIAVDFVNPINRLVRGMKKVQRGESDVYIQDDREDELGFLNKTFNEMSHEINHLVNWVYREQLTRKEAELKALQSQINPHFLFNTLESINWMAQLNNVPEISDTVTNLSSLMEASIGRDDRLITLAEEFTYTDKYISLLKSRFGDRMELLKNVSEEVLGIRIPRLLIQPLVENAVFHGIEKSRGKGIITLNASLQGDRLIIEVVDNGTGMQPEELEELNERLSMDNDTYFKTLGGKKNRSIGIENVNRRIKLFYGEDYGLKIESEAGSHTKVVVTVPAHHSGTREGYYVQGLDH